MATRPRTRSFCVAWLLPLLLLAPAARAATTPNAYAVLAKMKAALDPSRPSLRTMTFTVHSAAFNEDTKIVARQVRKNLHDGAASITVVTEPESLKGVALLVTEQPGKANVEYVYYPALRRSRRLVGGGIFESFLGTEFTYADLGLVDVRDRSLELLAIKPRHGGKAYEIRETPKNRSYYSRVVDWVAVDTGLPLERDHYDVSNALWRKQVFEDVATIDGIPTPMRVRIDDLETGDWSEFKVTDLHYDIEVADELFDPEKLREIARAPGSFLPALVDRNEKPAGSTSSPISSRP